MRRYLPALLTIGAILAWLFVGALKALPVLAKLTSFALHTQEEIETTAVSGFTRFPGVDLPQSPQVIVDAGLLPAIEQSLQNDAQTKLHQKDHYFQWLTLFRGKDYAALEKLAASYRQTRPRYPNGDEILYNFYYTVGGLGISPALKEGVDFNQQAVAWNRKFKPAYTAALLIAMRGNEGAWLSRGYDTADNTLLEKRTQFETLKTYAREWLDKMGERGAQADPIYYYGVLNTNYVGDLITETDHDTYVEGVKRYPDFLPLYRTMAILCLERWQGAPEDLKYFAAWAEDQRPENLAANVIYATVAEGAVSLKHDPPQTFQAHGLSWPHIKAGLVAKTKAGHLTPMALNRFFRLAYAYEDKPTAAVLAPLMAANYQAKAWNSDAEFRQALQWAGQ